MLSHSNNEREFIHAFQMASAYTPEMMPYTNYTYDFKGIIDYIFYPRRSMQPLGILGPIDQNYLRDHKIVGCPTAHMPSDHFSLYVELAVPLPLGSAETLPLLPPTSISSSSG